MTFGKFMFYCVLLASCVYGALTYYPRMLFNSVHDSGNVAVYTRIPLDLPAAETIVRAREKAATSDFFSPEQKFEVYLVGDNAKYALLAPFCRKDFSCHNPLTGKIFIALPDLERSQAGSPGGKEPPRVLESVITHELVKAQLRDKFSFLSYIFIPELKKEGYAEHIAMETANLSPSDICPGKDNGGALTRYLKYRLVIENLRFELDTTYPELLKTDKGNDTAVKRVFQKYCAQN